MGDTPFQEPKSPLKGLFDRFRGLKPRQIIVWGLAIALAVALFFFAYNLITTWTLTNLAGSAVPTSSDLTPDGTDQAATPDVSAPVVLPDPWDGVSRVTILAIGLDYRDWEAGTGAPRSDTMILLTIDPVSMTAGMISVPRDLWVNIPGFGYGKINTAYSLGESFQMPGLGPGMAMRTVEEVLGVPIDYYVQVEFSAFERIIDEIGGVKLQITETIELDPIGPGYDHVIVEPGEYVLPGYLALAYARNRETAGKDIDRANRQQQVIIAIRNRVLENFPTLVTRAPALYTELSAGIHTNMNIDDALQLAVLLRDIPLESIERGVIDYSMVTLIETSQGDALRPIPDQIRLLRDRIFRTAGALSPMTPGDETQRMIQEAARVEVQNGSYTEGLAARTGEYLTGQGMNVVSLNNAVARTRTLVIDYTGNPFTLRYLATLMNLSSDQIQLDYTPGSSVDVLVILGTDWAAGNPMP